MAERQCQRDAGQGRYYAAGNPCCAIGLGLPWEAQQSNKRMCVAEQWSAQTDAIELKVGDSLAASRVVYVSSAFGNYVYDTCWLSRGQIVGNAVVVDKASAGLRVIKAGESMLKVPSACNVQDQEDQGGSSRCGN
jgi:hypothetical protein